MSMSMSMGSVGVAVPSLLLHLPHRKHCLPPAYPYRVLGVSNPVAPLNWRQKNLSLSTFLPGELSHSGDVKRVPRTGAGKSVVASAALATEEASNPTDVALLKTQLLSVVAGLDRGLVATDADTRVMESVARLLEDADSAVKLPEDLEKLQGRWLLIYSSAFSSGSFGGRRPGPPIGRLPLVLGLSTN